MDNRELLKNTLKQMNIEISESKADMFFTYKDLLLEWNEKMNLTSITDEKEVMIKHFADSVSILMHVDIPQNSTVIDVGTGAGFPGIPIKIVRDDLKITLVDSLNKRIVFLDEVVHNLGLTDVTNIHSRAEESGQNTLLREQFDYCVSRAVANLAVLSEYCLPFVKVGGIFVSLKGPDVAEELAESGKALYMLGGEVKEVIKLEIPNSNITHSLVVIKKIKATPKQYPRKAGTAGKKPLK